MAHHDFMTSLCTHAHYSDYPLWGGLWSTFAPGREALHRWSNAQQAVECMHISATSPCWGGRRGEAPSTTAPVREALRCSAAGRMPNQLQSAHVHCSCPAGRSPGHNKNLPNAEGAEVLHSLLGNFAQLAIELECVGVLVPPLHFVSNA